MYAMPHSKYELIIDYANYTLQCITQKGRYSINNANKSSMLTPHSIGHKHKIRMQHNNNNA